MGDDLGELKAWIAIQTGLDSSLLERTWLNDLLRVRLTARRIPPTAENFLRLLQEDPDELRQVVRQVAVPETWFFRYPASFDCLTEHLRVLLAQANANSQLRMLSVACATGEEPLSMAMAAARAGWPLDRIRIDAFDREPAYFEPALQNRYSARSARDGLPTWSERWVSRTDQEIRVDERITQTVRFIQADVMAALNPLPQRYHIVFCRNLLIYLNTSARDILMGRLSDWLVRDGLLFVGHADAVEKLRHVFDPVTHPGAFGFRSKSAPTDRRILRSDGPAAIPPRPRRRVNAAAPSTAPPPSDERHARPVTEPMPLPEPLDDHLVWIEAVRLADAGQLEQALALCESTANTDHPEQYALLGSILLGLGRWQDARNALRKTLYLNPQHEEALLQLTLLELRLGNSKQAEQYRRRAAELHTGRKENDSRE